MGVQTPAVKATLTWLLLLLGVGVVNSDHVYGHQAGTPVQPLHVTDPISQRYQDMAPLSYGLRQNYMSPQYPTQEPPVVDEDVNQSRLPILYMVSSKLLSDNQYDKLGLFMRQVPEGTTPQSSWRPPPPPPEFSYPPQQEVAFDGDYPPAMVGGYPIIPRREYPPYYPSHIGGNYPPYGGMPYYPPPRPDGYGGYPSYTPNYPQKKKKKKPPSSQHYYQEEYYFSKPTKQHRPPSGYLENHNTGSHYGQGGYQQPYSPSYSQSPSSFNNGNKHRPELERVLETSSVNKQSVNVDNQSGGLPFINYNLPSRPHGSGRPSLKPSNSMYNHHNKHNHASETDAVQDEEGEKPPSTLHAMTSQTNAHANTNKHHINVPFLNQNLPTRPHLEVNPSSLGGNSFHTNQRRPVKRRPGDAVVIAEIEDTVESTPAGNTKPGSLQSVEHTDKTKQHPNDMIQNINASGLNEPNLQLGEDADILANKPNRPHVQPIEAAEILGSEPIRPQVKPGESVSTNRPNAVPSGRPDITSQPTKPDLPFINYNLPTRVHNENKPNRPQVKPGESTEMVGSKPNHPQVKPGESVSTNRPNAVPSGQPDITSQPTKPDLPFINYNLPTRVHNENKPNRPQVKPGESTEMVGSKPNHPQVKPGESVSTNRPNAVPSGQPDITSQPTKPDLPFINYNLPTRVHNGGHKPTENPSGNLPTLPSLADSKPLLQPEVTVAGNEPLRPGFPYPFEKPLLDPDTTVKPPQRLVDSIPNTPDDKKENAESSAPDISSPMLDLPFGNTNLPVVEHNGPYNPSLQPGRDPNKNKPANSPFKPPRPDIKFPIKKPTINPNPVVVPPVSGKITKPLSGDRVDPISKLDPPHVQPVESTEVEGSKPSRPHVQPVESTEVEGSKPSRPHVQPVESTEVEGSKPSRPHVQPVESTEVEGSKPSRPHVQPVESTEVEGSKPSRPHVQPVESTEVEGSKPSLPHVQPVESTEVEGSKPSRPHVQPVESTEVEGSKPSRPHVQPVESNVGPNRPHTVPLGHPDITSPVVQPTKPDLPNTNYNLPTVAHNGGHKPTQNPSENIPTLPSLAGRKPLVQPEVTVAGKEPLRPGLLYPFVKPLVNPDTKVKPPQRLVDSIPNTPEDKKENADSSAQDGSSPMLDLPFGNTNLPVVEHNGPYNPSLQPGRDPNGNKPANSPFKPPRPDITFPIKKPTINPNPVVVPSAPGKITKPLSGDRVDPISKPDRLHTQPIEKAENFIGKPNDSPTNTVPFSGPGILSTNEEPSRPFDNINVTTFSKDKDKPSKGLAQKHTTTDTTLSGKPDKDENLPMSEGTNVDKKPQKHPFVVGSKVPFPNAKLPTLTDRSEKPSLTPQSPSAVVVKPPAPKPSTSSEVKPVSPVVLAAPVEPGIPVVPVTPVNPKSPLKDTRDVLNSRNPGGSTSVVEEGKGARSDESPKLKTSSLEVEVQHTKSPAEHSGGTKPTKAFHSPLDTITLIHDTIHVESRESDDITGPIEKKTDVSPLSASTLAQLRHKVEPTLNNQNHPFVLHRNIKPTLNFGPQYVGEAKHEVQGRFDEPQSAQPSQRYNDDLTLARYAPKYHPTSYGEDDSSYWGEHHGIY